MAITPAVRWAVFRRDGFRCHYCGLAAADGAVLQLDHVEARSRGGSDRTANLVTSCTDCNVAKSNARMASGEVPGAIQIGDHCSTPLKIALVGQLLGLARYRAAYLKAEEAARGSRVGVPPYRASDHAWWTVADSADGTRFKEALVLSSAAERSAT